MKHGNDSKKISECQKNEFECACGEPKCIKKSYVGDGVANCQDASDETQVNDVVACADGTASRRNPEYFGQKFELCKMPNPCLPQFGQVCLNIHGRFRCICQLGMIRPPGPSIRCIPIEALPNALAQGATTNCSDLIEDLKKLYKYLDSGLKIESIRRSDEKVKHDPMSSNITFQLDSVPANQSTIDCPVGHKNIDNHCIRKWIFIKVSLFSNILLRLWLWSRSQAEL